MVAAKIELWFDFSCPYAYLASRRAPALAAELGAELAWRPMLLGGVFRGIGAGDGPMAHLSPEKARYNARDMHRWAARFDAPFAIPAAHPMRTVRALRVLLGLDERAWPPAIAAIYAAYWVRGEDVTRDDVIAAALRGAGVDPTAALARADSDAIKDELRRRTDDAIALGIFGAPAWVIQHADRPPTLLWGQDRMAWVAAVARGWDLDRAPPPGGPQVAAGVASARPLHVYVDAGSPFSYLATTQLARLGGRVVMHPIALGALFRDLGTANVPLFDFVPAKRRYIELDMQRWARWWGVPLAMPAKFPQRTLTAQRLVLVARERGAPVDAQIALARALGAAMWADGRDLEDDATLASVLAAQQLPADWLAATREPAIKELLARETADARAAGVFGVPSFRVGDAATGDALIWGQDRLELVAHALTEPAP